MFALAKLEEICDDLDKSKVLLIHAGGFSKRLPNVSVTGKIFAALPFGEPIYTMLEMKLASYIEFPSRMAPGVRLHPATQSQSRFCLLPLQLSTAVHPLSNQPTPTSELLVCHATGICNLCRRH